MAAVPALHVPVHTAPRRASAFVRVLLFLSPLALLAAGILLWRSRASSEPAAQPEMVRMRVTDAAIADEAPPVVVETMPPPVDARPMTIADAIASLDWSTALGRCAAAVKLSPAEHADCGVAACESKQRAAALVYYRAAPAAGRARVERACLQRGIELVRTTTTRKSRSINENPIRASNIR